MIKSGTHKKKKKSTDILFGKKLLLPDFYLFCHLPPPQVCVCCCLVEASDGKWCEKVEKEQFPLLISFQSRSRKWQSPKNPNPNETSTVSSIIFFVEFMKQKQFFSCFLYIWSSDMIAFLIMAVPIYMSTMYWDIFVGQISSSPAEHYAVQEGTWKHNSRNLSMIMFYLVNRLWYSWQQMYFR